MLTTIIFCIGFGIGALFLTLKELFMIAITIACLTFIQIKIIRIADG